MRRMPVKLFACALALFAPAALTAQPDGAGSYRDGSGRVWRSSTNANGAVLRSGRATIYLGRNCDVASPAYGHGRWEWANGGFLIVFRSHRIGFPRQEIDAGQGSRCRS